MEEEWTSDANEAFTISLVTPSDSGLKKLDSFNPKFTYAVFENEQIFGYKGLKVNLTYNATDMRPNLSVSCIKKFKTVGEAEAVDIPEIMKEFLPGVAFQKKSDFELAVKQTPTSWTPPGELVNTIERDGETYEIWKGSLADPAVKQLVKRIQLLVLFYIEGGSYIGEDADGKDEPDYSLARWSVFFLYKKPSTANEQYVFQGYSTVYHFWLFQNPTPPASPGKTPALLEPKKNASWELPSGDYPYTELPHRARISQFLILPPFQGKGAGAMLYNTIFDLQSKDDFTKEITVEDPNEAFDLLRDLCDMKYLRKNFPEFANLTVNPDIAVANKGAVLHHSTQISNKDSGANISAKGIVDVDALEALRLRVKIAPRQFWRLVEMHLMSKLPLSVQPLPDDEEVERPAASKADKHAYMLWRILLKQRLYRRNASILGEFEVTERIIKLNDTLENVEWEYARILERLNAPRPEVDANANGSSASHGKRKSEGEEEGPSSKKARVDDE
ncbi:histone acetyltransferase type B catalytic subunit [Apiospora marii]|uniref:histone acetyltransferase type B catalytic subunit n=1 Tax=Apiospora marii TaxID=335849 RepID=UPI00312E1852